MPWGRSCHQARRLRRIADSGEGVYYSPPDTIPRGSRRLHSSGGVANKRRTRPSRQRRTIKDHQGSRKNRRQPGWPPQDSKFGGKAYYRHWKLLPVAPHPLRPAHGDKRRIRAELRRRVMQPGLLSRTALVIIVVRGLASGFRGRCLSPSPNSIIRLTPPPPLGKDGANKRRNWPSRQRRRPFAGSSKEWQGHRQSCKQKGLL